MGDVITDCPLRSPHVWTPAEQQVPGKVHVFQDYDGPMPTQFFESPYSASLVKQGKLPPVADRLPIASDVSVISGPDGIGEYGGWYQMVSGGNYIGEWITASWNRRDSLGGLRWFPWIGKDWGVSDDGRVWTFTMRDGLKWSDGLPLDMEAVDFAWFNNFHPEQMPNGLPLWMSDQVTLGPPVYNRVDDLTWTLTYETPIFTIMEQRATPSGICGPNRVCIAGGTKFKKYYYEYNDKAAVDKFISDGNHADWKALQSHIWNHYQNMENIPCAGPYCAVENSENQAIWERNHYNWFVDPEGNQLPYNDGAIMPKVENRDVIIFRAMSGDNDGRTSPFQAQELPLYVQNMDKGDYSIYHWPSSGGSELPNRTQQTYNEDPYIAELIRTADFRRGLSHGLDGDEYNSLTLSSIGVVQNRVPRPDNPYYPGDKYKRLHIDYDVAKGNKILDGLGLTAKDADGYRTRPDGKGAINIQMVQSANNPMLMLASEAWISAMKKVGIKAQYHAQASNCWNKSECEARITTDDAAYQYNPWMVQWTSLVSLSTNGPAAQIGTYYSSKKKEGMAPTGPDSAWLPLAPAGTFPADPTGLLKKGPDEYLEGISYSAIDPKRIRIGQDIFGDGADQLWSLNRIGFSGAFRGLYLNRNNFRNKPITHERDHNGFTAWARFFEDGRDNYHNPGNKSKFCKSWAFIQGGSPYDRCTQ